MISNYLESFPSNVIPCIDTESCEHSLRLLKKESYSQVDVTSISETCLFGRQVPKQVRNDVYSILLHIILINPFYASPAAVESALTLPSFQRFAVLVVLTVHFDFYFQVLRLRFHQIILEYL